MRDSERGSAADGERSSVEGPNASGRRGSPGAGAWNKRRGSWASVSGLGGGWRSLPRAAGRHAVGEWTMIGLIPRADPGAAAAWLRLHGCGVSTAPGEPLPNGPPRCLRLRCRSAEVERIGRRHIGRYRRLALGRCATPGVGTQRFRGTPISLR